MDYSKGQTREGAAVLRPNEKTAHATRCGQRKAAPAKPRLALGGRYGGRLL